MPFSVTQDVLVHAGPNASTIRPCLGSLRIGLTGNRTFGRGAVPGVVAALILISVAGARHPGGVQGVGRSLLLTDVALLLFYGAAGTWIWRQRCERASAALGVGATLGLWLGAVLIANHFIESTVANRPFVIVIVPVLLAFALLGAAGSISYRRTRSLAMAVISGIWCGMMAMLVLLCFAFTFALVFEHRAELPLQDAFAASGMNDPGAFLVKNSLEAASEGLIRFPIAGLFCSLTGALVSAWIAGRTRITALAVAWVALVMFAVGATSLWYANTLERSARPPFVMFGVVFAAIALCSVHPAWSALRQSQS